MAQRRDRRSGRSLGTSALLALVMSGAGGTMAAMAASNAPSSRSPWTFEDCPFCPRMVVIPGGSFVMGSPPEDPMRHKNEGPQITVTIATFAVAETEVTRGQFAAFAKETNREPVKGCITDRDRDGEGADDPTASWLDPGYEQAPEHPVVCVSWQDAKDFAAWLSRKTGKGYRLLGEAEWEYAARGGTTTTFFWGQVAEVGCRTMNGGDRAYKRAEPTNRNLIVECDDGVAFTAPVGSYPANPFGLRDITGNAWELVEDCYQPSLEQIPTDGKPRTSDTCAEHGTRGGSLDDYPEDLRIASRHHVKSEARWGNTGFRVARSLSGAEARIDR